ARHRVIHSIDETAVLLYFFFQAEDGIRDRNVMEFRRVLFRSRQNFSKNKELKHLYLFVSQILSVVKGQKIPRWIFVVLPQSFIRKRAIMTCLHYRLLFFLSWMQ